VRAAAVWRLPTEFGGRSRIFYRAQMFLQIHETVGGTAMPRDPNVPWRDLEVEWYESADRVLARMSRMGCAALDVVENGRRVGVCQRMELERRVRAGEWLGALSVVDIMVRTIDDSGPAEGEISPERLESAAAVLDVGAMGHRV
jgi:hypothetical protein